ncbi:MAG TPA: cytochrome c biogenesis protein CcsA [Candidatus Tectomicrobia bacterium]|nr:cytochrome c biogenesis protein CcsA [Candidatus Tectomicrobia bacterium]
MTTRILGRLAVAGLAVGLVMGFVVAPREATQGNVQRIMYVHVPAVWVAYLAFLVSFAASLAYLAGRRPGADRLAHAACEVGALFLGVNIVTGSIWGKPTWGTWWTWDARLTTVSIVFVMYLAYLLLRQAVDDPERAARYGAVLSIVAALNIPIVHLSVYWWRTLHQPPSLLKAGPSTMPGIILTALLANFAALALLGAYFVSKRVEVLAAEAEALA